MLNLKLHSVKGLMFTLWDINACFSRAIASILFFLFDYMWIKSELMYCILFSPTWFPQHNLNLVNKVNLFALHAHLSYYTSDLLHSIFMFLPATDKFHFQFSVRFRAFVVRMNLKCIQTLIVVYQCSTQLFTFSCSKASQILFVFTFVF